MCLLSAAPLCAEDVALACSADYDALTSSVPAPELDPEITPAAARFAPAAAGSCPNNGHCRSRCPGCDQARLAGWYAGGEVTVFEPSYSNGTFSFNGDSITGGRLTVGYEGTNGTGVRGRFWGAGNGDLETIDNAPPFTVVPADFSLVTLDLDIYKRLWVGNSSIVLGAGPRGAGYSIEFAGDSGPSDLTAAGLGAFVEFRHTLWRSREVEFAFLGHGRASFLQGEISAPFLVTEPDGSLVIGEAAIGLEMRKRWGRGDFVVQYRLESQVWDSNLMDQFSLLGSNFGFGYQW